jgi:hypothetical protein
MSGYYYDRTAGNLIRTVLRGEACEAIQVLDGAGGVNGRVNGDVGITPSGVVYGNQPHVFYYDRTHGNLRHAWFDHAWHFEALDGAGGAGGRQNADLGTWPTAMVYGGKLHVVYVRAVPGIIREATFDGTSWRFQTLDGAGGPGRIDVSVRGTLGYNTTAAVYGGTLHLFYLYHDPFCDAGFCSFGAIREARFDGTAWTFRNPAGFPAPTGGGAGINCCHGGQSLTTARLSATQAFLLYENFGEHGSNIRAIRWNGSAWGPTVIVEDNGDTESLGDHASAAVLAGVPHVFYQGSTAAFSGVRDTRWNGTSWIVGHLDGMEDGAPTAAKAFGSRIGVLLGAASGPGRFGDRDLLFAWGP